LDFDASDRESFAMNGEDKGEALVVSTTGADNERDGRRISSMFVSTLPDVIWLA
jgi:hypothetical protein